MWSIGSFGSSFGLRLLSTIVLARLLDPHVLGIMVVLHALRYGIELLSDVGIEQNIVQNGRGAEPDFINTAWTLQIMRGILLSGVFLALAAPLGRLYDIETGLLAAMACAPMLNALHSTSIFLLVRNLEVRARMLFELTAELIAFGATLGLVLIWPSAWALLGGILIGISARSALSYLLVHPRHRLILDRASTRSILRFGGWMFLSSVLLYLSTNLDRLMLGRFVSLGTVGIYGLARGIADVPGLLAGRLSYQLLLPLVSARRREGGIETIREVAPARLLFVLVCALGLGTALAWPDWAIRVMFDPRYHAAEWMLLLLLPGAWFTVLGNLNEAVVLGSSRADLNTLANLARLVALLIGLPLGYWMFQFPGAIGAIVLGEIARYGMLATLQMRLGVSFLRQDGLATLVVCVTAAAWIALRIWGGLGVPWSGLADAWSLR